ncbi:MAG TPA: HAMP domain-containing sensor histidine kinase [Flavobacterium sp.]|jgi:signal transduction histidine kinase
MKQKVNLLIVISTLVLVALCAIQYYLVKTAYDHKVEQFHNEIKDKLSGFTNDFSDIDSTIFNKKDHLYKELAANYIYDKSTRKAVKAALLNHQFRTELTKKLQRRFESEFPDLKMEFAVVLDKFVIYDAAKPADTIFSEKPQIANMLYGNLSTLDDAFVVRNYVGTTSGILQNSDYKLLTEDTLYVSVHNWEVIIWQRMSLILAFAILSIATIVLLFVIAIRALIRQKKVSNLKTDFINNITHELKTPLTTLSVSTKILQRDEIRKDHQKMDAIIETISRQNVRLQHLIDQVMQNSLGFEEIELRKEKVIFPEFLATVVADFALANPNVAINSNFGTSKAVLNLDKFHLTTAISNVLENAVKYGCENIIVATKMEGDSFRISVQDDGIGISKAKHELLFDKFYRAEAGNVHNVSGLGLGLYYVSQILKAHQGSVTVASESGKGALFHLVIPVSS